MSEPNPEYKEAPFKETCCTPERGFYTNTNAPTPTDGEYHNENGEHILTIKDGKVVWSNSREPSA